MENTKKQYYTNWTYKLICENEFPVIGFDIIIKTILEAKKMGIISESQLAFCQKELAKQNNLFSILNELI